MGDWCFAREAASAFGGHGAFGSLTSRELQLLTWNLGGVDLDRLPAGLRHSWPEGLGGLMSLQELPRTEPGWSTKEKEGITVVGYRDELAWRGVGVGFKTGEWLVMRRKAKGRAVWLRMRSVKDKVELWVGSLHLSQGVSGREHTKEIVDAMSLLPPTTLPCVLGCDGNASLRWADRGLGIVTPYGEDLKAENMLGTLGGYGFEVVPPRGGQLSTPTSRPRKDGVQGHQIDFVAVKRACVDCVRVHVDSFKTIDGDHDFLSTTMHVNRPTQRKDRVDARPRVVVDGPIPTQRTLDQTKLAALAQRYTKPKQGEGYRDPADVKTLFAIAKHGGLKEDWKKAQQARKKAKQRWDQERLEKAVSGDWAELRRLRVGRGKRWETHFACQMAESNQEPQQAIHEHLSGIFATGREVESLLEDRVLECPRITEEEVVLGVGKAKSGKAVGVDQTSKELLKGLIQEPVTRQALCKWLLGILRTGDVPEDRGKAIMIVLPKVQEPSTVKDVRPIAMGRAVGKLFSRILLNRAMGMVGHETSVQCAGSGRQTADYLYSIAKSFDLEREWKFGTIWVKVDISKAFDTLNRYQFLSRLKSRMGYARVSMLGQDVHEQ